MGLIGIRGVSNIFGETFILTNSIYKNGKKRGFRKKSLMKLYLFHLLLYRFFISSKVYFLELIK